MAFWFPQLTYNVFIKGSAACAATATCRPAPVWIYKAQGISVVCQTRREKLLVAFCHASDLAPSPSSNESSPCGIRKIILSNASLLKCQFPDSSPEFRDLLASVVVQLLACSECGSSGNHMQHSVWALDTESPALEWSLFESGCGGWDFFFPAPSHLQEPGRSESPL